MSNPVNKVLYNVDQTADTTEAQKAQARANIGAQGQLTAGSNVTIDANNVISAAGFTGVSATAPIYGNGTAGNPLVLHTSHGLSLVQNSEDSTTSLQVTHPVPPPGSTSTNKVLTCVDTLENLEWRDVPESTSEVFLAEYGVATVSDISAAKNAGKEVFTLIPGTYYPTVAYLREVTRNGASANFASVVSNDSSVKTASVDSSGNWSNSTVNLAKTSDTSLIQKLNYGDTAPSRVGTLLIDSDDPEGYAQVKADNVTKGHLVIGPYKGLLDSGVNGVGDRTTPIYIDSNGQFTAGQSVTAGRNLWLNQNNAIQTNLPGGMLAPNSSSWRVIGNFASAYALMARLNSSGTVDVGLRYTASGLSSHYTFIGKQFTTVAGNNNLSFKKIVNIEAYVNYSGVQLGDSFDPSTLESMTIEGTMLIGTLHDFRVSVWVDNNNTVQVAFTAIEIGKTGATN